MKIIWITPECPYPANSGGRLGMIKPIEYISKNNDVYLFSIVDSVEENKYKSDLLKICKDVKLYPRCKNLKVYLQSFFKPFPAISRWNKNMRRDIEELCEINSPDLIIVDFPQMMGVLTDELLSKYKIVLKQGNIEFKTMENIANSISNPVKKIVYKLVSKQFEKYEYLLYNNDKIDLFTFVSIEDKKYFENHYNKKNTYLLPVGAEMKALRTEYSSKIISFVANMSYPPNINGANWLLDNVWEKIQKNHTDAQLYIVGKEPPVKFKQYAERHNNVVVTGMVESVESYYEDSMLVVIPVFNGGGVKVKLLEALGYGKLVVTTTKGIEGTEFVSSEHLLVTEDPQEFANYCCDVLTNSEKYSEIRKNATLKMQDTYTWLSIMNQFESYLLKFFNI